MNYIMIEELLLESICVPLLLRSGIKKYIAGIDLYSSKEAYAFDTFKKKPINNNATL